MLYSNMKKKIILKYYLIFYQFQKVPSIKNFAEKKATKFPYMQEMVMTIFISISLCEMQILEVPI